MQNSQAPDPDAILKSLDAELAMRRSRRKSHSGARTAFRVGSLLLLIVGLAVAMFALQHLLTGVSIPDQQAEVPAEVLAP